MNRFTKRMAYYTNIFIINVTLGKARQRSLVTVKMAVCNGKARQPGNGKDSNLKRQGKAAW